MAGSTTDIPFYMRAVPRRLVSGLLTVNVRNSSDRDDCVEEYYTHWGFQNNPPPDAGKASVPFQDIQPPVDPERTADGLQLGDYDTYLFFVTLAANMRPHTDHGNLHTATVDSVDGTGKIITDASATFISELVDEKIINNTTQAEGVITAVDIPNSKLTTDISWSAGHSYTIVGFYTESPTHPGCQSFVRYKLLAHFNNAYGHLNDTSEYYAHYGKRVSKWPVDSNGQTAEPVISTEIIMNDGIFSSSNFGVDLSVDSNNTWFNPVYDVDIYGKHSLSSISFGDGGETFSKAVHDPDFFNLVVLTKLFGYPSGGTDILSFFKNRINVFFQPFGETADIKFSTTEYTS